MSELSSWFACCFRLFLYVVFDIIIIRGIFLCLLLQRRWSLRVLTRRVYLEFVHSHFNRNKTADPKRSEFCRIAQTTMLKYRDAFKWWEKEHVHKCCWHTWRLKKATEIYCLNKDVYWIHCVRILKCVCLHVCQQAKTSRVPCLKEDKDKVVSEGGASTWLREV